MCSVWLSVWHCNGIKHIEYSYYNLCLFHKVGNLFISSCLWMQKQFIIDDIININVIVIVFVFIILLIFLFIYRLKFLSDHSAIIFTILHDLFENVPISKRMTIGWALTKIPSLLVVLETLYITKSVENSHFTGIIYYLILLRLDLDTFNVNFLILVL